MYVWPDGLVAYVTPQWPHPPARPVTADTHPHPPAPPPVRQETPASQPTVADKWLVHLNCLTDIQ